MRVIGRREERIAARLPFGCSPASLAGSLSARHLARAQDALGR